MGRADTTGGKGRGALLAALAALAIDIAIPILPIYDGNHFSWSGVPNDAIVRVAGSTLIGGWATSLALLFGIVMLRRHRSAVAAGVFGAIAFVIAGEVAATLVRNADTVLNVWQSTLVVVLHAVEAVALVVAASIAMRRWT
jgi:FtsH-binding integral membrane protein